jgi:hypothetical protein
MDNLCECGTFSFNLKTNLLTNSFSMDVKLSYDINKCLDSLDSSENIDLSVTTNKLDKMNEYGKTAYNFANNNQSQIAAAVTTSGLATIGTLLFAGLLGGKIISKKYKLTKSKKSKKLPSKKIYTRKYK